MSEPTTERSVLRVIVGTPRLWQGIAFLVLAVVWLALAVADPQVWRWIVGSAWLAIGLVQLLVALSDRRHGRGRYARR